MFIIPVATLTSLNPKIVAVSGISADAMQNSTMLDFITDIIAVTLGNILVVVCWLVEQFVWSVFYGREDD